MFKIEMKHWNAESVESITISDVYAAKKVYKSLIMAAVDTNPDIKRLTLRNPQGEIIAQCSF